MGTLETLLKEDFKGSRVEERENWGKIVEADENEKEEEGLPSLWQ